MSKEDILKGSVNTEVSFSKKEQQIKLFILDRKDASGGGQGCYNIPVEIFNEMNESTIIKEIDLGFTDRKNNAMKTYTLIDEYSFILSDNIKKLIEYGELNEGILLVEGTGTKIQINRRRCNEQKTMPDTGLDLEWFVKLYDQNPRPSQIIYILDKNIKTLKMDIEITYNLEDPDNVNELKDYENLNSDGGYDYKSHESPEDYSERISDIKPLDKWTQKIYFGPPGTGKSYNVSKEILEHQIKIGLIPKDSKEYDSTFVYRTTIYPEYNYYDFIGNIMPVVKGENITYDFKPGVFTLALSKALDMLKNHIPVYLVIEEMSRGNIASVFGDIFQILDRDENGISEYRIDNDIISDYLSKEQIAEYNIEFKDDVIIKKEIYLPSNLNILGTVNTSDQNVFVMDTAFKRRFEFEYVDVNPISDEDGNLLNEHEFILEDYKYKWNDFYKQLNNYIVIELELPEDKQIGQFFIKFNKKTSEENYEQIQNKLLPYLWDDIHLINMSSNSLFKVNYKSFSKLYTDFANHINVFHDKFMDRLSVKEKINYISEDEPIVSYTTYKEE